MMSQEATVLPRPVVSHTIWSPGRLLRQARARPIAAVCVVLIIAIGITAVIGPSLATDPLEFHLDQRLQAPGAGHLLGTDDRGRDVAARVVHGLRTSLEVGLLSAAIGVAFGLAVGLLSGYFGGRFDSLTQWLVNSFLAFPALLLAMGATLALGRSIPTLALSLALISWPGVARVLRAATLLQANSQYVESAVVVGVPTHRILFFHILPNVVSIFIVLLSAAIAQNILVEAALSFLGLGVRPPAPSLGSMVLDSQRYQQQAPWLILAPGTAIALTVFAFSLLGDAIRDALDPRLRRA
jgi:peptide/nickel transport system permease protein